MHFPVGISGPPSRLVPVPECLLLAQLSGRLSSHYFVLDLELPCPHPDCRFVCSFAAVAAYPAV